MASNYTRREYEQSEALKNAQNALSGVTAQKPAEYASKYSPQIDDMVGQILNRKDFSYDLNGDAMYQQYKDRYMNLGKQAMMDTMGQAATLTGGYGNSYAQMAGQQAYQGYLQGLNDKVPELYQLALDRYNQQGQDLYNKYGLLNTQEQNAYDRYMNQYNQWMNERDYLTGRYDTERGYDYGQYRDQVADDQWQAGFDEDLRRWNFANKQGEYAVKPVYSSGDSSGPSRRNPDSEPTEEPNELEDIYQQMYDDEQEKKKTTPKNYASRNFREEIDRR